MALINIKINYSFCSLLAILKLVFLVYECGGSPTEQTSPDKESKTKIVMPFVDFNIYKQNKIKIVASVDDIFVIEDENVYSFQLISGNYTWKHSARFDGLQDSALVRGIIWNKHLIIVAGEETTLNIYFMDLRNKNIQSNRPIQKIPFDGSVMDVKCFSRASEIYIAIALSLTSSQGLLYLFKWDGSYFRLLDRRLMPSISDLSVLSGDNHAHIIITRKSEKYSKVQMQIFEITHNKIRQTKNFFLDGNQIFPYTFKNIEYIFACNNIQQKCTTYQLDSELISCPKRSMKSTIQSLIYGKKFIVTIHDNELRLYENGNMLNYLSHQLDLSNVSYAVVVDASSNISYIALFYNNTATGNTLRFIQTQTGNYENSGGTDSVNVKQNKAFLDLRKIILRSRPIIEDISEEISGQKRNALKLQKNVKTVKISRINKFPSFIRKEIFDLVKRSRNLLSKSSTTKKLRILNARNISYNGSLTTHLEQVSSGHLLLKKSIKTRTINSSIIKYSKDRNRCNIDRLKRNEGYKISHLVVNIINNIEWDELVNSVLFRHNNVASITGPLTVQGAVQANKLITTTINDIKTDHLLTLDTDQIINSTIIISRFFTEHLDAERFNSLNFAEDIARIGASNFIKSPTIIQKVGVEKRFILANNEHANLARYLVDNEMGLLQIYTGKVVLNGSLRLRSIVLNTPDVDVLINGEKSETDFSASFWMKNQKQHIKKTIFKNPIQANLFHNVANINNHPSTEYLLRYDNNNNTIALLSLVIVSSTVYGSINMKTNLLSKLNKMNNNAIITSDKIYDVIGMKIFHSIIEVDDLIVNSINNDELNNLITIDDDDNNSSNHITLTASKHFKSIEILNKFHINKNVNVKLFNKINPNDCFTTAILIDNSIKLPKLILADSGYIKSLLFDTFNNFDIATTLQNLEITTDSFLLHKHVYIDGDLILNGVLNVEFINDINWKEYMSLVVFLNGDKTAQIDGVKTFRNNIFIDKNIQITSIAEGFNINEFFNNAFIKTKSQTITASWTFSNMKINGNIDVNAINDIKINNCIYTSMIEYGKINGNVVVKNLIVNGNMYGHLNDDDNYLQKILINPININQKNWKKITAINYATWNTTNYLNDFIKNVVRKSTKQVINGRVTIRNVVNIDYTDGDYLINKINISIWLTDCLYKQISNKDIETTIYAQKAFINHLITSNLISNYYLDVPVINDIDIIGYNASIYRFTDNNYIIKDKKIFAGSTVIDSLTIYGLINNIDTDNILMFTSKHPLPSITLSNIITYSDISIKNINDLEVQLFLTNRVRLYGIAQELFGFLTFESLILLNDCILSSINNIKISNIITKNDKNLQLINKTKKITGSLIIVAPALIFNINDYEIIEKYQNTIMLNENYYFDNFISENVVFNNGLIVDNTINTYNINDIFNYNKKLYEKIMKYSNDIHDSINNIQNDFVINQKDTIKKYIYLQHDTMKLIEYNKTGNRLSGISFINRINDKIHCLKEQITIQLTHINRIYVNTTCTNSLQLQLNNLLIIAENYDKNSIVILSWDNYHHTNITFNYKIKKIETFKIINTGKTTNYYILIQFMTSITLIKLDAAINQLITLQQLPISIENDALIRLNMIYNNYYLIYSTGLSLSIYKFNQKNDLFMLIESIPSSYNNYNIIEIDNNQFHLILTCTTCNQIDIYEGYIDKMPELNYLQSIKMNSYIMEFICFTTLSGKYLIIATKYGSSYYYVYKYEHIESWIYVARGYFDDLNMITYLLAGNNDQDDYLFIMGKNQTAAAIAIYTQG